MYVVGEPLFVVVDGSVGAGLCAIGLNTLLEACPKPKLVFTSIGLNGRPKSRSYAIMGDVPLIPYIAVIVEGDALVFLVCTGIIGLPIFFGCSDFTTAMGENLILFALFFFEPSGTKVSLFFCNSCS
jgi:hypothetical protein